MKFVFITPSDKPITAHNYRINIGFIHKLSTLCEAHEIKAYNKNSILIKASDIYDEYKPDAFLLLAHSEVLNGYLRNISCLKVMIAVDFYKVIERQRFDWYKNNKFDLVAQRGIYDTKLFDKHIGTPCFWLPYCADEKEFYPYDGEKIPLIGFSGTISSSYKQRKKAIELLEENNLIDNGGKITEPLLYTSFLRKHVAMLTSTEISKSGIRSPHVRMFEIMASGSMVLSPGFDHNLLSGCYMKYKDDCSDIVEKARSIIHNTYKYDIMIKKGYEDFLKNHTDNIRVKELYDNIVNMIEGRDIVKKWGI